MPSTGNCSIVSWIFFFFQAEDGIRDTSVTGVQTCALPIFYGSNGYLGQNSTDIVVGLGQSRNADIIRMLWPSGVLQDEVDENQVAGDKRHELRSEERRVGKRVNLGGRRMIKKKNERMTRSK